MFRACTFITGVCLGKIRSLLPYQPVYSKEMVDKMEKIETEKTLRSNRASFSLFPLDCDCNLRVNYDCLFNCFLTFIFSQNKLVMAAQNKITQNSTDAVRPQPLSYQLQAWMLILINSEKLSQLRICFVQGLSLTR